MNSPASRFKFRAWYHPDAEEATGMLKFTSTYIEEQGLYFVCEEDPLLKYSFEALFESLHEGDDWQIEQSTGLTDKNGIEIYEGDIVRHEHSSGGPDVSVIRWTEGDNPGFRMTDLFTQGGQMVVLGNIHQNKDLLK